MKVWKWLLPTLDVPFTIPMPHGAKVVHFGFDPIQLELALWALVDPSLPVEGRNFVIIGTGEEAPPESTYVGTYQHNMYVWHLFEASR